jgi:hypothetical protein
MIGTSFLRRVWYPACRRVHNFLAAYRALDACLKAYGYRPGYGTGAANCRAITGGSGYSLHSYFGTLAFVFWNAYRIPLMALAVDINPPQNPYSTRLITNMPRAMIDAIYRIRTNSGHQVWQWGGYYSTYKDAMHFEVCCTPAQLDTGINPRTLPGGVITTPAPAPTGDDLMQSVKWYRGDPTAPGDQTDVDAAYMVTSAKTKWGKTVETQAVWIPNLTMLSAVRYAYGGVESQTRHSPKAARNVGVHFVDGPFTTEDLH